MPADPETMASVALQERLKAFLQGQRPDMVLTALSYQLAATVGEHAPSVPEACKAIDAASETMKAQVMAFWPHKHP